MANRLFRRNILSLDEKLVTLEAAVGFLANGAPELLQWIPATPTVPGHYAVAPQGGCGAIATIQKRTTGDFSIILQDGYQNLKGVFPTWRNSAHLGIAAPIVREVFGEIADTYPDLTDIARQRLAAGHTGTAVVAAQPTFTVNSATFPSTMVGLLFTDSAGVSATIIAAASDTITLAGNITPATGSGWTITASGTIVLNATILSGARSSTAFTAATFTVSGATWLVNQWRNHVFTDSAGAELKIASNTATILTFQPVAQGVNPTTGAYVISQGYQVGNQYTITGTAIVAGTPGGTGGANAFTPSAHVNWYAGQFAGMTFVDSEGTRWLITTNSTTVLTVASNGSNTTPADGAWSILALAGGSSIEFTTAAQTAGSLTAAAQVFTGDVPAFTGVAQPAVNNTPAFSGTGLSASGQVLTSTDNQTMTLNQCAGMLLISATGNVVEIVSNTAVTGAPAVLTVRGKATTDAGVYNIFRGTTPTGTVAAVTGTNASSAVTGTTSNTLTDPASGEVLLLTLLLSDDPNKE